MKKNNSWPHLHSEFDSEGVLRGRGLEVAADHREGKWCYWYGSGALYKEEHYKDNKLTGIARTFYDNGQIYESVAYVNGEYADGVLQQWHRNGNKDLEVYYKYGKETGKSVEWYSNGQIHLTGMYCNGNLEGVWDEFSPLGVLVRKIEYINGIEVDIIL